MYYYYHGVLNCVLIVVVFPTLPYFHLPYSLTTHHAKLRRYFIKIHLSASSSNQNNINWMSTLCKALCYLRKKIHQINSLWIKKQKSWQPGGFCSKDSETFPSILVGMLWLIISICLKQGMREWHLAPCILVALAGGNIHVY